MEIKPTYCSFDNAKLLRQKGFNIDNISAYYQSSKLCIDKDYLKRAPNGEIVSLDWNKFSDKYSAPEQWMVVE